MGVCWASKNPAIENSAGEKKHIDVDVYSPSRLVGFQRGVEHLLHFDAHIKTRLRLVIPQDGIDKEPGADQMFVEDAENVAGINAL